MPELPAKDSDSPEANAKHPKKGMLTGKNKWYVVGGLAIIAVLVFVFVRKSNANDAGGSTSGQAGSGLDPATAAALQGALMQQGSAAGQQGGAVQGPAGEAGPAGPTGPAGGVGPAGPPGKPSPVPKPKPPPPPHKPPPHKPPAKRPVAQYYTVKPGDSLSAIASRLHISGGWHALYNLNRGAVGSNPNLIHPGLRLRLP